jgi:amidase
MNKCSRRDFLGSLGSFSAAAVIPSMGALAGLATGSLKARAVISQKTDGLGSKTAVQLAGMIRNKEIGSLELTQYFIDRIERVDTQLNAVVVRDFDRAVDAARGADAKRLRGDIVRPLHGLPMTIKESFDIAGLPTTWGIPALLGNVAARDSDVVTRFKAAGAHFLGKTNVPLGLGDFQTHNDIYGTTRNPWNLDRIPGGSSGGSAATLAAGMTALDSGSDIGGSIRNPAHYCGVYGHKPTWGVISGRGHSVPGMEAPPDLAVVGPMARSAEDLALALELIAGPSALDAPGWQLKLPPPRATALGDYRVAVWATDELSPASSAITNRIHEVADALGKSGATVSEVARPEFSARESHYTYLSLLNSFLSAGLSDSEYQAAKENAAGFDPSDQSSEAMDARAKVLEHRDWLRFHNDRTRIRRQWQSFFKDWDIVLCPIMVTTAFPHDHSPPDSRTILVDGVETPYWDQVFWAGLATLAFLPSTVFPTGLAADGLPIGLQAISAEYNDRTTIEFSRLLAREIGAFVPPPAF